MTPAGTSNELDVQNKWEENTHTHTRAITIFLYPTLYRRPFLCVQRTTSCVGNSPSHSAIFGVTKNLTWYQYHTVYLVYHIELCEHLEVRTQQQTFSTTIVFRYVNSSISSPLSQIFNSQFLIPPTAPPTRELSSLLLSAVTVTVFSIAILYVCMYGHHI